MKYLVIAVLAGCSTTDSPEERFDNFAAAADINCFSYGCNNGPGPTPAGPPIEPAVACMNDALESGARATASWGTYSFANNTNDWTVVFTVDHKVKVFTTHQYGLTDPLEVMELPDCTGPFRAGPSICLISTQNGLVDVDGLAWDGCP